MNDYTNVINLDLLKNSSKVLSSLESCLKNVDFTKYLVDLEDYIKKLNFEHGNCIVGYKEDIKTLIEEIDALKGKVDHLQMAIDNTTQKFDSKQNLDYSDFGDLAGNYDGSINQVVNNMSENNVPLIQRTSSVVEMRKIPLGADMVNSVNNNANTSTSTMQQTNTGTMDGGNTGTMDGGNSSVTVIPPANGGTTGTNGTNATTSTSHQINTIPIGLGIAATGITASAGAVILDGMKDHSRVNYESYKPDGEENYESAESAVSSASSIPEEALESADAYHAARNKKSFDKFYGENNEYYEDENN